MTTYTITERNGCCLVDGDITISALSMLTKGMPRGVVMDTDAARMLGVKFAIGSRKALDALKNDPQVLAQARALATRQGEGLSGEAKEWLATGEHGTSSETIFGHLTGKRFARKDHPHDPDDLRRCRLLLERVSEFRARLNEMAGASAPWAKLVAHWDELCALMDSEAPHWRTSRGSAPLTYQRMRTLIVAETSELKDKQELP